MPWHVVQRREQLAGFARGVRAEPRCQSLGHLV
jgi:hypothetical protein